MDVERDGVVNELPVKFETPPLKLVYQFIAPELAEAERVNVPASHLEAGEVDEMVGVLFIVAVIGIRGEDIHPFSVTST